MTMETRFAPISTSGVAGDKTLLGAVAGVRVRVLSILMVPDVAVTVTFKSGATAVSGPMALAAKSIVSFAPEGGVFDLNPGEALVLTTSATANIGGVVSYILEA